MLPRSVVIFFLNQVWCSVYEDFMFGYLSVSRCKYHVSSNPPGGWFNSVIQGSQLNMAVFFWCLVKSDLSSVHCTYTHVYTGQVTVKLKLFIWNLMNFNNIFWRSKSWYFWKYLKNVYKRANISSWKYSLFKFSLGHAGQKIPEQSWCRKIYPRQAYPYILIIKGSRKKKFFSSLRQCLIFPA